MMKMRTGIVMLAALTLVTAATYGKTSNGNDFALYLSEARTPAEQKALITDAMGRPHYFRYLFITAMQEGTKDGRPFIKVQTVEPASRYDILFIVDKPVSLQILKEAPGCKPGDAIAVTGKISRADPAKQAIELDPVIVRNKDRLEPAIGKELLYDMDPNAICYSYTGASPGIKLPYKHKDLLDRKDEILDNQGPQAWVDYVNAELAKRKQAERKQP